MREPMYNYELFKKIFGLYATELWAKPEKVFLEWLNAKAKKEVKPIVYGKWKNSSQQGEIGWIEDENGKNKEVLEYGEIIICKCSNCGYEIGELALEFNFCPNCGAKMK